MSTGLIFIGLFALVLGPFHWYLWQRLVKDTTRPGRWRVLGTLGLLFTMALLLIAFSRRVRELIPFLDGTTLTLPGYLWVCLMLYLALTLLVLELPRFLLNRRFAAAPPDLAAAPDRGVDERRRLLIARGAAVFAGLTATAVVGNGVRTAYGPPVLKRVQIPLSRLPRSLDGYKIAVVSDIHLGNLTGVAHTRRIVSSINGMSPDLIAVVGDLVDGRVSELREQARPLRELASRDGAFFVTGNHEYYSGVDEWLTEIEDLGMRPLRNERLEIRGLDLAGVDDVSAAPDYESALGDRDPGKPVILLAHQPVAVHEAARHKVDLQLSGHTHGGQIWPFHLVAGLQQPVISGLAEVDGTTVYVTNGAGFWGPPVRVGAPPDITLVELRAR